MKEVYLVYRHDYPQTYIKILHGSYATPELAQKVIEEIVCQRKNLDYYKLYEPRDYVYMEALEVINEE